MGKPVVVARTSRNNTANGSIIKSEEPIRRSQHSKDLEQIRRNALAIKRELRSKHNVRTRTKLEKTLGQFASTRREFEDALQINNSLLLRSSLSEGDQQQRNASLLTRSDNNTQKQASDNENPKHTKNVKLQKPINYKGFFRAGIKSKELTRPLTSTERFKQAVLNNDALQIFQSGNFLRPAAKEPPKVSPLTKMEISKVLKEFTDSSDSEDPLLIENQKSSPIFKSYKNKTNAVKLNNNRVLNDIPSQNSQLLITKPITKEDKCKRRLFEEENTAKNIRNCKYNNNNNHDENNDAIRCSQRKLTPENVIFFSEYVPANGVNNKSEKKTHKISPTDPKVIQYYNKTFKLMAQKDTKTFFKIACKDPMKSATVALTTTYVNAFKGYISRQKFDRNKQRSELNIDLRSESSTSEIMVEPDSAIARKLKKNNVLQIQNAQNKSGKLSNSSSVSIKNNNAEKDIFDTIEIARNHFSKRKYTASSKSEQSDPEVPSSVKVNVDINSVRMSKKMDFIHRDRQELTARYLNDITTNSQREIKRCNSEREIKRCDSEREIKRCDSEREIKRCDSDDQKDIETEFSYHYEKKKFLTDDDSGMNIYVASKNTKHVPAILRKNRSVGDCTFNEKVLLNLEKELDHTEIIKRTKMHDSSANTMSERTPNCNNPTSNQTIEAPKCKYMYMNAKYNQPLRISAPVQARKLQRNAPVQKMKLFPTPCNPRENYILSQNSEPSPIEKQLTFSDDLNELQMFQLSQGSSKEIQDRTNRLTLHSSQNCSQDNVDQMLNVHTNHCSSHRNVYFRTCEPSINHLPCNSQQVAQRRGPPLQIYDTAFNPHAITRKDYHMQTAENKLSRGCVLNEYQMYKSHQPQSSQYHDLRTVCMQEQSTRQPVKFIAIEGNRMPQKRPIYGMEDDKGCSHTHKPSVSSQQFNQVVNPCYQRVAPEQKRYALSSIPCHSREVVKYENVQREPNFTSNEFPESGRKVMNFVPNNISDQNFPSQRNIPMHRDAHNQRYVGPVQVKIQSPAYSPVTYQHYNHPSNTMFFKVDDIYLEEMNHNIHQNRP